MSSRDLWPGSLLTRQSPSIRGKGPASMEGVPLDTPGSRSARDLGRQTITA